MAYDTDYPTEPIGHGNPYYRCVYCKVSTPEINGRLEAHPAYCIYRIVKEYQAKITELENELKQYRSN